MSVLEAIGFGAVVLWIWWLTRTAEEIRDGVKYVAETLDADDEPEDEADDEPEPEGPDDNTPEEFVPLKVVGEK